jgi:hypothetical protein
LTNGIPDASAKLNQRSVGICGEAPANYLEITRFLTELGIDSISVSPSSISRTPTIITGMKLHQSFSNFIILQGVLISAILLLYSFDPVCFRRLRPVPLICHLFGHSRILQRMLNEQN